MTAPTRIEAANLALFTFAKDSTIVRKRNGFYVQFDSYNGLIEKRWQTRGQDFYPVWYSKWGHGGTASTALSQLIRWCQKRPVFGIGSWQYWAGDRCRLCSQQTVDILRRAEYPEKHVCVICHQVITSGLDWWSLNGVSGPCCSHLSGCRQEAKS